FRRLKKFIVCALLGGSFLFAAPSQAGITWFSRANCFNNESISRDWPANNHWLWTNSYHYKNGTWEPTISTGWEYTYRSAAVHWREGFYGGYYVVGDHWRWLSWYGTQYFGRTQTNNCNLGYFFPYW
ncbi:MAG: hypothetical protein ACREX0_09820, partial [Noviherbaspirillum sp.]